MKDFQSMVEEAKVLVQKEIKNKDNRPGYILEKQLSLILDEIVWLYVHQKIYLQKYNPFYFTKTEMKFLNYHLFMVRQSIMCQIAITRILKQHF